MKKFIITMAIMAAMVVPASAASINLDLNFNFKPSFDVNKAQPSINNAITEIISKPTFDWSSWLDNVLAQYK